MRSLLLDPRKAGFYQIGDSITYSKLEAIEYHNRTGDFPEWNFNRLVFDSLDWSSEPKQSLSEIYRNRCRQIRDAYDYVVLFYSGGSDSHNILQHWLTSGCKLDEIASYWNYEGSKDEFDLHNAEIKLVVMPMIEHLRNLGHDFVFRLIDHSQIDVDTLHSNDLFEYEMNCNVSINTVSRSTFRDKIADYRNMITSGKKVCFVWGIDKPQIFHDDKGHYIQFLDIMDQCSSPYAQKRYYQGWFDELFYWTPDMPELIQKQARLVKRFLDTSEDRSCFQTKKNKNGYSTKLGMYLKDNALRTLIYPFWNNDTFSNGKNVRMFFSTRAQWLWNSNLEEATRFVELGKSLFNKAGDYWVNDPKNIYKGFKCHASPHYYL